MTSKIGLIKQLTFLIVKKISNCPAFTRVFAALQRGKELEKFTFLDGKYLLLNDGTGFFSSKKIHCKNCCEKHHRKDGSVTYYHQKLLSELSMSFITVVKPDGNKFLFDWIEGFDWSEDFSKHVDFEHNTNSREIPVLNSS